MITAILGKEILLKPMFNAVLGVIYEVTGQRTDDT